MNRDQLKEMQEKLERLHQQEAMKRKARPITKEVVGVNLSSYEVKKLRCQTKTRYLLK